MRKVFFPLALAALIFASSCNDAPKADIANSSEAVDAQPSTDDGIIMSVDLAKSGIEWVGSKPMGMKNSGNLNISKAGLVLTPDNQLSGGYFIMDIANINPTNQDEEGNEKLKKHLLSDDFFDADNHPQGTFEITSVSPVSSTENLEYKDANHLITGNLTLKGITKSITFPAKVQQEGNKLVADAEFNIIRTDWNINFNSDASIKDKFINKEVNLKVHLEAEKTQVASAM